MADVDIVIQEGDLNAMLADAEPPTSDYVSITADGRRLDSAEAVMEFIKSLTASGPKHQQ